MYYLLKASPAKAFRRWRQEKIEIELAGRVKQPVFYHPVRRFSQNGFVVKEKRPVGLLIPPSYLETWARAQAGIFKRLLRLEMFKWPQWTATLADHTYLLLKKQA